jgi:hypothetical protein
VSRLLFLLIGIVEVFTVLHTVGGLPGDWLLVNLPPTFIGRDQGDEKERKLHPVRL